ncbi:phasin family protein [Acinetobacter sp. LH3_13]|uniref:phasin family protein n=1 Tax=Acinetobacter sp. LH3_13 TaxID=3434463 RepID=UPI003EBDB8DC
MEKMTDSVEEHLVEQETTLKNKDKLRSGRKSSLDFRKYTKQIWLAGLGAFSRAEEEGNKLFDSLVKVGEELEFKTTEIADQTVEKVSEKAKESVIDTKDKVERLIDHSVNHSLNRIGLVTAKDLQHLEQLVLQLHTKVDALIEENKQLKEAVAKN